MGLTSTLFTGLSGMNVNQQRLNVIGNNIANVNTVSFKSSRALFKPQFYVTDNAGSPPTSTFGGVNPSQRGMGAQVSTIQKNFTSGQPEVTGINTDLAVQGDGFFVVQKNGQTNYTRDGSFSRTEDGFLVSGAGEYVQGFGVDKAFNVIPGQLQNLEIPIDNLTIAEATTKVQFKGNLNSDGPLSESASVLESPALLDSSGGTPTGATPLVDLRNADDSATALFVDGSTLSLLGKRGGANLPESTFTISSSTTVDELNAFFQQGLAINTSADVLANAPAGFTPGAAFAATTNPDDPAGSLRLQITGNAGVANGLSLAGGFRSDSGQIPLSFNQSVEAVGEGLSTSVTVYDSLGTPVNLDVTLAMESKNTNGGTTWRFYTSSKDDTNAGEFDPAASPVDDGAIVGTGTIEFDNHGVFIRSTGATVDIQRSNIGSETPLSLSLDMGTLTSLRTTQQKVVPEAQDGFQTGSLSDFSIAETGDIVGNFTNGLTRTLGRVAIATFDNQEGLIDEGGNNFSASGSSGDPTISAPGEFSAGTIKGGALEQSNVDLSKEFIDMIVTSTGFSAASRVITTSNRLLDELLQTSR